MGKVAFCWELGGGLGHIAGFLPVANHLKEKGHEVIFIVKSLLNTEQLVGQYGFKVFQAPNWPSMAKKRPPTMNYAEIILNFGFLMRNDFLIWLWAGRIYLMLLPLILLCLITLPQH
ncbi:MAG: hypothetical protein QNK14_10610 [Desulfobacterales bacterium]|nr:hypothetical protein [Desulfobacterales bacterium]